MRRRRESGNVEYIGSVSILLFSCAEIPACPFEVALRIFINIIQNLKFLIYDNLLIHIGLHVV